MYGIIENEVTDIVGAGQEFVDTLNHSDVSEERPITLEMFEFIALEHDEEPLPKSGPELRRAKFSKWIKHQFGMRNRGEAPLNIRDRSAFSEKNGELHMELRYGTSPLKAIYSPWVVVKGDEDAFESFLLKSVEIGLFDDALELTAKRKPSEKKKAQEKTAE